MDASDLLTRLLAADREYRAAAKDVQAQSAAVMRAAREQLGLSQREMARQMGVNHTTISKVENGHLTMGRPMLAKLARVIAGLPAEERPGRVVAQA